MIDFGGTNAWRIFQATEGNFIYGLTTEGAFMENWDPLLTESALLFPLRHLQMPRTDYLIGLTDAGRVTAWNRLASPHFSLSFARDDLIGPLFGQQLDTSGLPLRNRLVIPYRDGRAQIISLAGETFNLPFGRGPADHFLFTDLWGDERADYLVQRGGLIHLFAYEGDQFEERWQFRLEYPVDTLIAADELGFLALSQSNRQIYLVDGEGRPAIGFPVAGEGTAIPVYKEGRPQLIVTKMGNRIYGYGL